jgi:hypothetical protein
MPALVSLPVSPPRTASTSLKTRCAIRRCGSGPEVCFALHVRQDNSDRTPPLVRLKAVCGPGDDGAPCVTVLLIEEN